jgi:soluble lytic murein transglycosylase-like protein
MLIRTAAVCVLVAGFALPASAQRIYSWRDENGNLVVSNMQRPAGSDVRSYAVGRDSSVLTTSRVVSTRVALYENLIVQHAQLNGLRADLVRAVVQVESGFNPYAHSPKGAKGLMQLMPATAREFGVTNPYNPVENVRAGTAYLRQLLDRYDNNEELALAAYNAGPNAVDKYGETVPPYRETRNYVQKIDRIAGVKQLPGTKIYQVTKIVDGRAIVYFTDQKPAEAR